MHRFQAALVGILSLGRRKHHATTGPGSNLPEPSPNVGLRPSSGRAVIRSSLDQASSIQCSGGPGTTDPVLWRCSSVPLGLLITIAYGFQAYQFRPNDPCCIARFDITAKVAEGTTKEQFQRMIQNLLEERFRLKLHLVPKEMPVYALTVEEKGLKMKESGPDSPPAQEDPWEIPPYTVGKDGYPVFPAGHSGLAGPNGHYRWVGFRLS